MTKSYRRKKRESLGDSNVNITALMDVLTVLLFFLIKSFTVSASSLSHPKGIRLPASLSDQTPQEAVVLSVTREGILANNEMLVEFENRFFVESDIGADGRSVIPLKFFLEKQQQKRLAVYQGAGDISFLPPGKILLQADKKLSFNVLKYVLHTASTTGYADYQFVVDSKPENQ